jgi:hypothetical protein
MSSTVEFISGMNYGLGFNSVTLDLHPVSAFLNATSTVTPADAGGQDVFYSIQIGSNSLSLAEQLKTSASASLKYGVSGSGSAKASFASSINQNSYTLYVIVTVTVTNHLTTLDLTGCSFSPDAVELLHVDPHRFLRQYGDSFIYGITNGGEFIGVLQMETSSSSELTSIKAKISGSASYGLFSGSASAKFSQAMQEITSSYSLKGTVMRRGGSGPLIGMTAEELVSAAIKFPQDVGGNMGYNYSAIVIPYAHIPHPGGTPIYAAHQASILDQLGRIRERMVMYSNDLLVAIERSNQFPGIILSTVSDRFQRVNDEIAKVVNAAKSCYAQASECAMPEIDFSVLEPVLPIQNEKLHNSFEIDYKCLVHSEEPSDIRRLVWSISAPEEVLKRINHVEYILLSWHEDKRRAPGYHYPYLEWGGTKFDRKQHDQQYWQSLMDTGFSYDMYRQDPWRPRSLEVLVTFDNEMVCKIWYNTLRLPNMDCVHAESECPYPRA